MKTLEELIDEFVINYDFEKYADGIGLSSFQKELKAIIDERDRNWIEQLIKYRMVLAVIVKIRMNLPETGL